MLTLSFIAAGQLVAMSTRVSALRKAALIAPDFATARASTFQRPYPPSHSDIRRENARYLMFCHIWTPGEQTTSSVADTDCYDSGLPVLTC